MRYLTSQEIIALNFFLIDRYSPLEIKGVKEPLLLGSAVHRPMQSAFGEEAYPDVFSKAAALFESIAKNHCFHNANKRTALVALRQFLHYNGYSFMPPQKETADFVVDTVNGIYEFEDMVNFIETYSFGIMKH
ncbi:type II toxin-antitoxin system death-on-curing family toxin [Sporosarcina sp. Marseille-Q4063]|uniref:type II toxin-antitoxin system death-on-curing family toxin n=1 Tax=Sporosarcina sp. Marseille-Q4063 TaxID=2810514 RepID=UPI001BB09D19|nr:type II toxin-antitoxin system death-on-curing family toxin [Sporosarcina sp. Marseille-Q4063]QUW20529.1 type II toxin-antitoxin system death-on-curing family toxin [Sporosarcina sp. Marseille-Q4063]